MHQLLAQLKYKNPGRPMSVLKYAEKLQLPFFPWWVQHRAKLTSFLTMLDGWLVGRT